MSEFDHTYKTGTSKQKKKTQKLSKCQELINLIKNITYREK